jgi:AcrR family transcriptional regulator
MAATPTKEELTPSRKKSVAGSGSRKKKRGKLADQRQKSRARLIGAGRQLGIEGKFLSASVDGIVRIAGLSRPAFYLHFKSKEELLEAVLSEQVEIYAQHYRTVSPRKVSTQAGVVAWLNVFVSEIRQARELMALFWVAGPITTINKAAHQRRCAAVEVLGHRLPALRLFHEDGSIDPVRQLDLLLFIYQLELLTHTIAAAGNYIDSKLALETLADHFLSLLAAKDRGSR